MATSRKFSKIDSVTLPFVDIDFPLASGMWFLLLLLMLYVCGVSVMDAPEPNDEGDDEDSECETANDGGFQNHGMPYPLFVTPVLFT